MLRYISPTSLKCFETGVDTFVLRYILGRPRHPQTKPMSIGSAFDARIKALFMKEIFGLDVEQDLLESQVEKQNQEWAFEESKKVFQDYVNAGCAKNLLKEVDKSVGLRFEFEQFKTLTFEDGFEVPLFGKPDMYFQRPDGLHVVIDWKVNGYCSQASPAPGYVKLLGADGYDKGPHKNAFPQYWRGILCNVGDIPLQWRDQLRMYTWMIGEVGDWVAGVDQLVYRGGTPRYAIHRLRIAEDLDLRRRLRFMWECVQNEHYYYDRSKEESDQRVEMLQNNSALADCLDFR